MSRPTVPAKTGSSPNAVSMLAHRLRRWPNIETALGEHKRETLNQSWNNAGPLSLSSSLLNPLSASDVFKRIHTVFPQLKFDRN